MYSLLQVLEIFRSLQKNIDLTHINFNCWKENLGKKRPAPLLRCMWCRRLVIPNTSVGS